MFVVKCCSRISKICWSRNMSWQNHGDHIGT